MLFWNEPETNSDNLEHVLRRPAHGIRFANSFVQAFAGSVVSCIALASNTGGWLAMARASAILTSNHSFKRTCLRQAA